MAGPSMKHIFGCDEFGRDLFLRIIWGTKYSLFIGVGAIVLATLRACRLGMLAGYYGKNRDNIIMRVMDVILAVPDAACDGYSRRAITSTANLIIAMSVSNVARFSRISRAAVMTVRDNDYIEAARAIGTGDFQILTKHIFPNSFAPILVQLTLGIGNSILLVAGLSYLGLGVQPPYPEWGAILTSAKVYICGMLGIYRFFPEYFSLSPSLPLTRFMMVSCDAMESQTKKSR